MHEVPAPAGAVRIGHVDLENSCRPADAAHLNRAVALLHTFWLNEARQEFERIAGDDPDCALAYWGQAFSELHLVNGPPSPEEILRGQASLTQAAGA